MNILLIYPPNGKGSIAPSNFEPLALEVLASTVPDHYVTIVDMRFESFSSLNKLLNHNPFDLAGVTVNNTLQVNRAKELLTKLRSWNSRMKIIVGGHHPSLFPEDFYQPGIDAIFAGWAEKSFPQYVDHIQRQEPVNGLTGVVTLQDGYPDIRFTRSLDLEGSEIPYPSRRLVTRYEKRYKDEMGRRTALINTARGCPWRCSFCSCWRFSEGRYLARNAESVFAEITRVPGNVGRIFFADDNTFYDIRRAEKLGLLLRKAGIRKQYSGYCRTDTIVKNPGLIRLWREIGLDNLCVGFEGISNERLKELKKANRAETNQQAIDILNDIGVPYRAYFMIDPGFREDDFSIIDRYIQNHNIPRPMFVVQTPLPGTDLYEKHQAEINRSYDYFDFIHWLVTPRLGEMEFYRQLTKMYYRAYSLNRFLHAVVYNMLLRFKKHRKERKILSHVSFTELIKLRIVALFLSRKLKHYAILARDRKIELE